MKILPTTKGFLHFHFTVFMLGNWDKKMNEGLSLREFNLDDICKKVK